MISFVGTADGLYLRRSSSISSGGGDDDGMRTVRANKFLKISTLIPIVNSTRPERQLLDNASLHSSSLAPPTLSRQSSVESAPVEFVYYYEVFIISGIFSAGFDTDNGEVEGIQVNNGPGNGPGSIGLHINGDLWIAGVIIPNWTRPFRNGDTLGCGVALGSNANYFFTRNGEEIHPGDADCHVPSIQTALIPCVGVSSAADTVIRTNFGFHSEHPFLWKGRDKVRIISHVTPNSTSTNNQLVDDSIRSDDAFLPTDLVRGHTIGGGDTNVATPEIVCAQESGDVPEIGEGSAHRSWQTRRHSELLPARHGAIMEEDIVFARDLDVELAQRMDAQEDESDLTSDKLPDSSSQFPVDSTNGVLSFDLNDVKELARELRNAAGASDNQLVGSGLSQLVDVCKSNMEQLNATVQRAIDRGHDVGELLAVHELVTDAIEAAEKKRTDMESIAQASRDRPDIYSLLCHLRGQKHKRYDAVWGLLR